MEAASSSSADEWHWLVLSGLPAVSLFANPAQKHSEATIQWILPGFEKLLTAYSGSLPMKGLWNSEKSASGTYRPALDALKAVDPSLVALALLAVVERGCALMVSATRDHGAICLTLLDGNDRHKVYPTGADELAQALQDLVDSLSEPVAPPQARRPKR